MDVVVTPSAGRKGRWQLKDRLRRKLGEITQVRPDHFIIRPTQTGRCRRLASARMPRLMTLWTG